MGKEMRRKHSIENDSPGCMWGIFHLFDFHQRHYVRRLIFDKRHGGGKHDDGGTKIPSMKLNVPSTDEAPDFMDVGINNFREIGSCTELGAQVEVNMKEMSPTKKSGKLRMKALIAEEMSKEKEWKQPIQAFPARLLRIDSIHHLEHAEFDLPDEMTADTSSPRLEQHLHDTSASNTCYPPLPNHPEDLVVNNKQCDVCGSMNSVNYLGQNPLDGLGKQLHEKHALLLEKLDDTQGDLLQQKSVHAKEPSRNVALQQSKQFLGAVEIFNASRELFLKILQDQNSVRANQFDRQQTSTSEIVLTKSESFPRVDLSGKRNSKLTKLEHEQKETGPEIAGMVTSLENQRNNGVVVSRFKDIKQRIQHAIKESRKEGHRISMDGILHKIPYGRKASKDVKREMVNQWKESTIDRDSTDSPRSSYSSDCTASARTKDAPTRMRRASSLSESLDRYSQLLESPLSEEPKKHLSDRLKLGNEIDGSSLQGRRSRTFGRILSLPEYESYFSARDLQSYALDRELEGGNADVESHSPDEHNPVGTLSNTENCTQLDNFVKNESRELYVEVNASGPIDGDAGRLILDAEGDEYAKRGGICNNSDDLILGENKGIPPYEETGSLKYDSTKLAEPCPISVLDSYFQEDIPSSAKFTVSKGSESEPRQIYFDEPDPSINPEDQSSMDASNGVGGVANLDEAQISSYNDRVHFFVDRKDEAEFNYVRDVLKKSGFCGDEFLGTWYSPDQPVDPSLFEEVDATKLELDMTEDEQSSNYYCQLLFDLINEVLLEIYERSFNSQVRPMPVGYHVLEEVWASMSRHFSLQPQLYPSLDYVVAQDLAKTDGWMNLQSDTECVALELEVLILDDLLEEATTILLDGID